MTSQLHVVHVKDGTRQPQLATADLTGSIFSLTMENGEVLLLDSVQVLGFLFEGDEDEAA